MRFVSEEIVERIKLMEGVGFHASENSLPLLFQEVFGLPLKKCGDCKRNAFDTLIRIANKQTKQENSYMDFKIKKQYEGKNFAFRNGGVLVMVNSANLNEERARWMLASKYAHVLEGQPDPIPSGDLVPMEQNPNVLEASTASTSQQAKSGGKTLVKVKKGKLVKS